MVKFDRKFLVFWIVAVGLVVGRICLGRMVSVFYLPEAYCDDALMVGYACFDDYFRQELPGIFPLHYAVKDLGYPLFVRLWYSLGMYYTDGVAILWTIAAGAAVYLFRELTETRNPLLLLAVFAFVLFHPAAFDAQTGTRLYRNSILAPTYLIVFALMTVVVLWHGKNKFLSVGKFALFQTALSFFFVFAYFVKEDGLWLLLCLLTALFWCAWLFVGNHRAEPKKALITYLFILCLPLLILGGATSAYKEINYRCFGVREINVRMAGEMGRYSKFVYDIASPNRTPYVWAPADAVLKTFEASPSLRDNYELREAVLTSSLAGGDIYANPIPLDFVTWVLFKALYETGTCVSVAEVEDYLHRVNEELELAFEKGELTKDGRIRLMPSMGGRTLEEIIVLPRFSLSVYAVYIGNYGYTPGAMANRLRSEVYPYDEKYFATDFPLLDRAKELTRMDFDQENEYAATANRIAEKLCCLYRFMQTAMIVMALAGLILGVVKLIRRDKGTYERLKYPGGIIVCFGLLSFVYICALGWFYGFTPDLNLFEPKIFCGLKFACVGAIPMLIMIELAGVCLFWRLIADH